MLSAFLRWGDFVLDGFAPAAAEDEFGYESESETTGLVFGAGVENELPYHELETPGPVAGFENDLLKEVAARGQVRRLPTLWGLGMPLFFSSQRKTKKLCLEISGNDVSRNVESLGASGVAAIVPGMVLDGIFETSPAGMVLDGIFTDTINFEDSVAAFVPSGSSSCMISSTGWGEAKETKGAQFFVNYGNGLTTVVSSSANAVVSDVLHLDADEYAVCGSRLVKVGCTLSGNGIGNGSNVRVLRRLRGGASSYLDVPGQWECKVCHATRCWLARRRCYKCDAPRDTVPNNHPMGPLGRALPQSRSSGPPTRSSGPRHVPLSNKGNGNEVPPAAGFGPGSAETEVGKKGEESE